MDEIINRILIDNKIVNTGYIAAMKDVQSYLSPDEIVIFNALSKAILYPDTMVILDAKYVLSNESGIVLTEIEIACDTHHIKVESVEGGQLIKLNSLVREYETFIGNEVELHDIVLFAAIYYLTYGKKVQDKILKLTGAI